MGFFKHHRFIDARNKHDKVAYNMEALNLNPDFPKPTMQYYLTGSQKLQFPPIRGIIINPDSIAITKEEFNSICSYIESIPGYIIECVTDTSIKYGNLHIIHSSKCDIMKQEFYNNGYCNKRIITIHAIPNKPYYKSSDDLRIIVDQEMVRGIMKSGFTCYDVEKQRYINKKYPFMHIELMQIDPHPVYGIVIPDFTLRIN